MKFLNVFFTLAVLSFSGLVHAADPDVLTKICRAPGYTISIFMVGKSWAAPWKWTATGEPAVAGSEESAQVYRKMGVVIKQTSPLGQVVVEGHFVDTNAFRPSYGVTLARDKNTLYIVHPEITGMCPGGCLGFGAELIVPDDVNLKPSFDTYNYGWDEAKGWVHSKISEVKDLNCFDVKGSYFEFGILERLFGH